MTIENLGGKTRIEALRGRVQSGIPQVCVERARLMTESYKKTESEPTIIRRAKALDHILSNMTIGIIDGELIVGNYLEAFGKRGCPILIEYSCDWFEDEIDGLAERDDDKAFISEEDKKILRELIPYWQGKTLNEKAFLLMPEELRTKYLECVDVWINEWPRSGGGLSHIVVDYEKVITQGVEAVSREAREHLQEMNLTDPIQLAKSHFYTAVLITHKAVTKFATRYSELARVLEKKEQDSRRKAELREIAEICERVPAKPATTFHEALQSLWFVHIALQIEAMGNGIAPGRMDQYLFPYYRKDLQEGRLDREKARELLQCFLIKLNTFVLLLPAPVAKYFAGLAAYQNITLGGVSRDGKDATNELSYLLLEADGELSLGQPESVIRVHRDMPRDFLIKACEVAKKCRGKLKFVGDKAATQKLLNQGFTIEDARDYAVTGCFELMVPGKLNVAPAGHLHLLLCLELALNNGVSVLSGKQLGPQTGNPKEFKSIQDVLEAYRAQVAHFTQHAAAYNCALLEGHAQVVPTPLQSSLVQGCLEKGIDQTGGGALHSADWLSGVGAVNVGDSLAAIKKCVFDESKITMEELLAALHSNFEGKEEIRQALMGAPKFGNDDDYVDLLTKEAVSILCDEWQKLKLYGGIRQSVTQLSGLPMIIPMGRLVGASADGRKSGEAIADGGVSPAQGRNVRGAAATFKSVAKLDHVKLKFGEGLNMRFSPDTLKDDRAMQKFATLLQTYFDDLGGFHAQFNIVSTDTLRDAQRNPEKYSDLLVRVATYTAYFIELNTDVQNDIIRRAELGLGS